jgi:hypothetical protein
LERHPVAAPLERGGAEAPEAPGPEDKDVHGR